MIEIERKKQILEFLEKQTTKIENSIFNSSRKPNVTKEEIDNLIDKHKMYHELMRLAQNDGVYITVEEYQKNAMRTLNPEIHKDEVLLDALMGLNGEAGEAINILKKHRFQGHDLDKEHLISELGDVCWYLAEACYALNVNLQDVMNKNIDKLMSRYPDGFTKKDSLNRKEGDI